MTIAHYILWAIFILICFFGLLSIGYYAGREEVKSNESCWGNTTFELSIEDIAALLEGKTLAGDTGEYRIFIMMEK